MSKYPKISVVTPNYNQGDFIEQTIVSVIEQGYPNLEYIVIDGLSSDNSIEIIKKYESQLAYWVSEKDEGMYDAINKGFSIATGDIMCWINSDDMFAEKSLFIIASIFNKNPKVNWVMGYPTILNEEGEITWQGQDAKVHSPYFFYLHNHLRDFSFIQQESCVWRRQLWEKAGGAMDMSFSLAADFDLWLRFFKHDKLYFSRQRLAGFRKRAGQQSENKEKYILETNRSVKKNSDLLPFFATFKIFILKLLRRIMFAFKNKKIRNYFYTLQRIIFQKPTYVNE